MAADGALTCWVGWDSREPVCSDVAKHSILKRTDSSVNIKYLKHRELRGQGCFTRPWLINGERGEFSDMIDGKTFSTEFSHTRFLVPYLMGYRGWALFMDADMIFLSDIQKLFDLCDDQYAVMCVKHNHIPANKEKMDGREQRLYHRKNWSSFVLWNCGHEANKHLTPEKVNFMHGKDLHAFSWLTDKQIGQLPYSYNFISGISPSLGHGVMPAVIHYTDGGPWFESCADVPYAGTWIEEYEDMQANSPVVCSVPTTACEKPDRVRK